MKLLELLGQITAYRNHYGSIVDTNSQLSLIWLQLNLISDFLNFFPHLLVFQVFVMATFSFTYPFLLQTIESFLNKQ
jgi:hypothetical protein